MVERQTVFTVFNDAVHLLFQLAIQRGQAITHVAVGAQFFNDDPIQCRTSFLQTGCRSAVDPRQIATQRVLIVDRFLTFSDIQRNFLAIELHVALRRDFHIAVSTDHLHALRFNHHIVLRLNAAFVGCLSLSCCHQQHSKKRFTHHIYSLRSGLKPSDRAAARHCVTT